jgi:hypothetical protein
VKTPSFPFTFLLGSVIGKVRLYRESRRPDRQIKDVARSNLISPFYIGHYGHAFTCIGGKRDGERAGERATERAEGDGITQRLTTPAVALVDS